IWRGEESNRILWDQPIPHLHDNNDDSNHDTNIANPIGNIFHIESQTPPMDMQSDNVSEERTRANKRTKTKIRSSTSIDNTSKRKTDLEKLMKDTNRLAPINPSLS
ncbi:15214_t:CDS:2, partial [Dentiscutata erythropus]